MISCQTLTESEAKTILKNNYNNVDFVYNNDNSHIIEIYFSNSIIDKIPDEIKAFKYLKKIEFEKTKLKELNFDNIVNENLESIIIYNAPLKLIPSSINRFKNLKKLVFKGTNVSKLPIEIFDLKYLQTLNFSKTKVIRIPIEVFRLKTLSQLYVNQHNDIPKEITELHNLKAFGGSFNNFNNFKYLSGLKYLSFNDCLSNNIPTYIGDFDSLTNLNFINCNIRSFPDQLFRNIPEQQLYLNLHGCDSLKSLPKVLTNSNSIGKIILDECPNFNYFPPGMYINSIQVIDANWKNLPKNFFKTDCHDLWIDGHEFHSINGIKNMKSLGFCVIINGNIEVVPKGIMELPELHHINLENNKIRKYPQFVRGQKQFDIALGGNPIEE
ncbi:hypothetical protein NH26_03840 [Flammeovirga pacifica]|uniref:Disease resistance R13L4/SHOC-2-like LRR domain-containing protein n=3 Tax=Flammeovirga pacifica TaxID=915059 RepID=A0A1S1YX26_FLAPC|nr:hypothetical protein NH26_03840 [Flammeovirga pacifica]